MDIQNRIRNFFLVREAREELPMDRKDDVF
jgi:hypothetical protein